MFCLISRFLALWKLKNHREPNAEFYLDSGRPVTIYRIVFYTRADFTHDAWWEKATVSSSDGNSEVFALKKKDGAQSFTLDERTVLK